MPLYPCETARVIKANATYESRLDLADPQAEAQGPLGSWPLL